MSDGLFAILPVRSLTDGKSRLSPVLDAGERARLNERLFEHTLECLAAYPGASSTLVASGSAEVLDRARRRGMTAIADPPRGGLNEAAAAATAVARARGAQGVFVLPVDLPLLTAAGLRDLLAQALPAPICLLVPDRRGAGTNLIYQSPIRLTSYAFGDGSFERHSVAAQAAGLKVVVRRDPIFGLDLDLPADYTLWRQLMRSAPLAAEHRVHDKAATHGV
jgi:2-phospho-L-lactate/phosphoenolpyruvate guanylyltransferase